MTNEEKDLLIAYLVDASEIDPDGGIEAQFLDWYQIREETVSGEVHYKAILDAARGRKRAFEEGRKTGLAEAKLGWDEMATLPGLHRFMDHARGRSVNIPTPSGKSAWRPLTGADRPVLCPEGFGGGGRFPGTSPALAILGRRERARLE